MMCSLGYRCACKKKYLLWIFESCEWRMGGGGKKLNQTNSVNKLSCRLTCKVVYNMVNYCIYQNWSKLNISGHWDENSTKKGRRRESSEKIPPKPRKKECVKKSA